MNYFLGRTFCSQFIYFSSFGSSRFRQRYEGEIFLSLSTYLRSVQYYSIGWHYYDSNMVANIIIKQTAISHFRNDNNDHNSFNFVFQCCQLQINLFVKKISHTYISHLTYMYQEMKLTYEVRFSFKIIREKFILESDITCASNVNIKTHF